MSFATAVARFAAQAARSRQSLFETEIEPLTSAGQVAGPPRLVALTPVRLEQEPTENGVSVVARAQLRVRKGTGWVPVERTEFRVVSSGEVYRCLSATGADSNFSAEIVCEVVRLSP